MFAPDQWADPAFLAFIKEIWDSKFKQKYNSILMNVVFYISQDESEVKSDILVTFKIAFGQITLYMDRGKKIQEIPNTIYYAGTPALWRDAAKMGSSEPLLFRAVFSDATYAPIKREIAESLLFLGNSAAGRLGKGERPSITIEYPKTPIKKIFRKASNAVLDMLDEMENIPFQLEGMEPINRIKARQMFYKQELTNLREIEPKNIKKYWKHVKELPDTTDYKRETDPLNLPIQIFADPNLKTELLAFKEGQKTKDNEKIYTHLEDFLERKVLAVGLETPSSASSPLLEFPIEIKSANMKCQLEFIAPIRANPRDPYATQLLILDKLDKVKDFKVFIGDIEVFNRSKFRERFISEQMESLQKYGSKGLKRFWHNVEQLPRKEEFRVGKTPFGVLFLLIAEPQLKSDLIAIRGKFKDKLEEYAQVEAFLDQKLKI